MNEGGDKMVTNAGAESATRTKTKRSRAKKKLGPFLKVKFGSAAVPIYRTESKGRVRYTLSFYRDGRRMRKMFNDLESAKKEALFVAQRIQSGMQHVTDLKPHERDSFKAAVAMLEKTGIPLVAAIEDYTRALKIEWPRNVLRHSFISYRIASVKSADQVALEAGNSPSIIFKHSRN